MFRKRLIIAVAAAALFCLSATTSTAQDSEVPGYTVVHGWPSLPPGEMLGQATGVGLDSTGRVFVFHRAGRIWTEPFPTERIARPTIHVFNGDTGAFVRAWGSRLFIMPHGLTIDGSDNVWVTDVGLHQVFKFSPEGELLLTLGEAGVSGDDAAHFNLPTDVAVLPDGSFFISDGYANTRVMKFSAEGRFLFQWGRPGAGPGEFDLPHAVDVDSEGRVYVADRSNARVQVFDGAGRYLTEWNSEAIGRPYSVALSRSGAPRALVLDGGDQPESPPDRSGATVVTLDGRVLNAFGRFGPYDGQFRLAHDGAIARDGSLYVVDAHGQRVQKFIPTP